VPSTPGTYATLSAAAAALAAYNLANFGYNNPGSGTIWMLAQDYGTGDQTSTFINSEYLTITRKPGLANGQARIIGYLSLNPLGPTLNRYYDLDFAPVDGYSISDQYGVWFDSCRFDGTADVNTQPSWESGRLITTHCTFSNVRLAAFLFSTGNYPYITRGNTASPSGDVLTGLVLVGNTLIQGSGETGSTAALPADGGIVAFNWFTIYGVAYQQAPVLSHGWAFVNNLIEKVGTDSQPATAFWADGVTVDCNHLLQFNNTVVGERSNELYNDRTPASFRTNCASVGNSWDWSPTKHDEFNQGTGGEGPNPTRIKGMPRKYGVNYKHNNSAQSINDTFPGVYFGIDGTRAVSPNYTSNASESGTNSGGGNYVPATGSSLIARVPFANQPIAFDLAGNQRSTTSTAIGAFAAAGEATATAFTLTGASTATPGTVWTGTVTPNGPLSSNETVTVTDDLSETLATINFSSGASTGQTFNWTPNSTESGARTLTATASPTLGSAPTLSVTVANPPVISVPMIGSPLIRGKM